MKFDDFEINQEFHGCSGKEILYVQSEKPHYEVYTFNLTRKYHVFIHEIRLSSVDVIKQVGSFKTITISKSLPSNTKEVASLWKLDDNDEDYINADELLDENDLQKPDPSSLKGI